MPHVAVVRQLEVVEGGSVRVIRADAVSTWHAEHALARDVPAPTDEPRRFVVAEEGPHGWSLVGSRVHMSRAGAMIAALEHGIRWDVDKDCEVSTATVFRLAAARTSDAESRDVPTDEPEDKPKPWIGGPTSRDPDTGSEGWDELADCAVSEYVGWDLTFGARMTIGRDRECDEETGAALPEAWSFHLSLFDRDGAAPCTATVHKDVTPEQVRSYARQLLALADVPADESRRCVCGEPTAVGVRHYAESPCRAVEELTGRALTERDIQDSQETWTGGTAEMFRQYAAEYLNGIARGDQR